MKKISLILITIMAILFTACEKDKENVVIKDTIASNTLNALSSSSFVLSRDNADETFQTFSWTAVDYGFDAVITGVVQFDASGNDFADAIDLVSITHNTTAAVNVGDFNELLLGAGYTPDVASDLDFRVKSTIHASIDPVYSNTVTASVTPYATTFPPIYMCGSATGGWSWDLYTYKEMRSTAPNIYQTIAHFQNVPDNNTFRFFTGTGWGYSSYNYPYFTGTVSALFENANDGDLNLRFIGTSGYYEITVNLNSKSISMEAVDEPVLYMTGAALGGWDWTTNYVQLTWKSNGIFQATTDFAVETFRFFKQAGWGDSYNYPYFADGTVSDLFENANDGDSNFKFIGTPGTYKITVNLLDLIVSMEAAK